MGPGARSSILLDRLCAISLALVASLSVFMMWEVQHRCGYTRAARRLLDGWPATSRTAMAHIG